MVSKELLSKLKKILKNEANIDLSDLEAEKMANYLVEYFYNLYLICQEHEDAKRKSSK